MLTECAPTGRIPDLNASVTFNVFNVNGVNGLTWMVVIYHATYKNSLPTNMLIPIKSVRDFVSIYSNSDTRWTDIFGLKVNRFYGQPCCYGKQQYFLDYLLSAGGIVMLFSIALTYKDLVVLHNSGGIQHWEFWVFISLLPIDRLIGCIVTIVQFEEYSRLWLIIPGTLLAGVNFLFLFLYPYQKAIQIRRRIISEICSFATAILKVVVTGDLLRNIPNNSDKIPNQSKVRDYQNAKMNLWLQITILVFIGLVRIRSVVRYLCTKPEFFENLESQIKEMETEVDVSQI